MIFVNFKTYIESSGEEAMALAREINELAKKTGVEIISCPQTVDLQNVSGVGGKVFAQHVDAGERGRMTGWFLPEIAKEAGASGTILNHSEHKLHFDDLEHAVADTKKAGLKILICAKDLEEVKKVANLNPDFIGYEPPELIASRDTSVARAKPEVIKKVVDAVDIPIIVGAGIKDAEDVSVSLGLGAKGVLVASAVVKSTDRSSKLMELAKNFK